MKWLIILAACVLGILQPGFAQTTDTLALSLSEALKEAGAQNDLLKKSQAAIGGSQALLQQSEGAFLPRVNANLIYSYLDIVPGFKKQLLGNIEHDILPTVSISQTLYSGGKLKQSKIAAETGVKIQQAAFQDETLNLKYKVSLVYYELQALQNQIQILKENRRLLQTHRQYARLLVEAGRMSQLELDRIAVSISDLDGILLKRRNDYLSLSYQMAVALGRQPGTVFIPADSLHQLAANFPQTEMLNTALQNNPAWKRLELESKLAQAKINIQKAARLPQVSASAWYGYEFGLESFSFSDNKRYYVGLNAQMPIYTGGVINGKIEQARSAREQVTWQQAYFKKSLSQQIKSSQSRLKEMQEQILIQEKALEHAKQSYRLALIEYHAGRRSNTDLLDIQKTLLNSQLSLNEALVNYNKSQAGLRYLMGLL